MSKIKLPHLGIEMKTSKLVESLFVGNYKTRFKGNGLEFVDFREYQFGDDTRKIDFLRSSQSGKTMIKLFEEEKELGIYLLHDFEDICIQKKYVLLNIIKLIGFGALKQGDKIGGCFSYKGKNTLIIARKGQPHLMHLFHQLDNVYEGSNGVQEPSDNSVLQYFNSLKMKKNLVFLLTDKSEISQKYLKSLSLKHDLVVIHIFSHFENYLEGTGLISLKHRIKTLCIDLDDEKKKNEYIHLRKKRIYDFKNTVLQSGAGYIYLDEKKDFYKELSVFMKKR